MVGVGTTQWNTYGIGNQTYQVVKVEQNQHRGDSMSLWGKIIEPVANLFTKGLDIIDKYVPDKDLAEKLKNALAQQINDIAHNEFVSLLEAQTSIIITEAKGDSWLQRNWRPLIMAEFGAIIFNNYILAPYLGMLFGMEYKIMLEIPPDMWSLLKLGLSGYVVGRSMEKIADGNGVKGALSKIMNGK
jgi:hypothetical protein